MQVSVTRPALALLHAGRNQLSKPLFGRHLGTLAVSPSSLMGPLGTAEPLRQPSDLGLPACLATAKEMSAVSACWQLPFQGNIDKMERLPLTHELHQLLMESIEAAKEYVR